MNATGVTPVAMQVFPPALVPALRERLPNHGCLAVPDEILNELVTTTFCRPRDV
jgi:hypothetical protein